MKRMTNRSDVLLWTGCLAASLVFSTVSVVCAAAKVKAPPEPVFVAPDVSGIFGESSGSWSFTDKQGRPGRFSVQNTNGVSALVPESAVLFVRRDASYKTGTELTALVRFDRAGVGGSLKITGGLAGTTNTQGGISVSLASGGSPDEVRVIVKGAGPNDYLAKRTYKARWLNGCRLGVPEDIRVRVEHQISSLPLLNQKWLKVRWQLREDGSRLYVDDRLLWESPVNTAGRFSLELSRAVELARCQAAPLAVSQIGFEPIILDGYLNAAKLDGSKMKPDSLPANGMTLAGVPFTLPRPDVLGNDHVDLEPSWLQNGMQGGRDSPRDGVFGGRWEGAWSLNPARIQFAIPSGRYSAIHLLAASDSDLGSVPVVTAQFYVPSAGRPVQVRCGNVQRFTEPPGSATCVPAALANGRAGNLYLITIPIEPGSLAGLGDTLELELTKEVRLYRAFPDPLFYSFHQAGLPSAVHVYALTLERPSVKLDLQAANGLHVWEAPAKPAYKATLSTKGPAKHVTLNLTTASYDGQEKTSQKMDVTLRTGVNEPVRLELDLKKYGYHELTLTVSDSAGVIQTEKRGLALLHPDTRERGGWDRGKGPLFGFWNWRGGFDTPAFPIPMTLMGMAGAETDHGTAFDDKISPETKEAARKYGMKSYKAFGAGDHYVTSAFAVDLQKVGLETAKSNFVAKLDKRFQKPDDLSRPLFISFFPEPGIGMHTFGVPLSYEGFSETNDYLFTADEEKKYQMFLNGFVEGAKIVKERFPDVKCLMPHGDPGFPPPFLRRSPEVRKLLDGLTVDIPVFERLPEGQMNKVALHRMYIGREEFRKAGIPNPWMPMYEGPCLPARPGSLSPEEHAALSVRNSLILLGYGVDFQTGGWAAYDAGGFWGEQHYGSGICETLPLATPKPTYAAYATMTRQLNRRNFDKWVATGSLSTYALQFKHYKDKSLVHTFWTIRGRRPVTVKVPADAKVALYDSMDNLTDLPVKDGSVTFMLDQAPCYVAGLPDAPAITLGEPDQSDSVPAKDALPLAKLGDGSWSVSAEPDADYENLAKEFIRKHPGKMTVRIAEGPADKGGSVLAVHFEKPDQDSRVMPFFTTLVPKKPVVIPGKASHLGLWVNAASDWGRVVYCLRDAKGERWLSIGPKGAWNNDDMHSWSSFNFDGWRYLRFELPACSPFDLFREAGSTWWGNFGTGDRIPDLPLTLEKLIVERRTHAMYVNDPQPTSTNDVMLGGLLAEYETPDNKTEKAVELSRLRMPIPTGVPELDNPIQRFEDNGVAAAVEITDIVVPLHESDGTKCNVQFTTVTNAVSYELWASPYPDGRGAVKLSSQIKASGALARGFTPDTDFYLFVIYTDSGKKSSKPSKAFHINLKDTFSQK